MKKIATGLVCVLVFGLLAACGQTASSSVSSASLPAKEEVTILLAAAASLETVFSTELIPLFTSQYPNILVKGSYDSSGKLQTQIEEGLPADIFMSAATKQMNALQEKGFIQQDSIVPLLENKLVLIGTKGQETGIAGFEELSKASTVALGEPASVPAGQYAQQALTSLGIWEQVQGKASFGGNVTEVLNWVAEGSAPVGIVYATDAALSEKVEVLASAPAGSLPDKNIYPVGMLSSSQHTVAAKQFIAFLQTEEALQIFEEYGFTPNVK